MVELQEMGFSWGEAQAAEKDWTLWRSTVIASLGMKKAGKMVDWSCWFCLQPLLKHVHWLEGEVAIYCCDGAAARPGQHGQGGEEGCQAHGTGKRGHVGSQGCGCPEGGVFPKKTG